MFKNFKFWKEDQKPIVLSRKDVVFTLNRWSRAKRYLSQIVNFLHGSKDNIAFLKINSKEINYIMIPVELFDQYQQMTRTVKRYEDDVYIMSQIVKELNGENKEGK